MASQDIGMSIMDGVSVEARSVKTKCEIQGELSGVRVNPVIAALAKAGRYSADEVWKREKKYRENKKTDSNQNQRKYKKECIVKLSVKEKEKINDDDLLDTIEEICGKGALMACVPDGSNHWEITLREENHARVLLPSFMVDEIEVSAKQVYESTVNVSFLHMSTQIPNSDVENKLKQFGVELISPISERFYKNREGEITDGTRFFTIRFPENRKSLPYSVRFNVNGVMKHYKVVHNNMQTVCLICSASDHLARKCQLNKCYSCNSWGHIAMDCPTKVCYGCGAIKKWCDCATIDTVSKELQRQREAKVEERNKKYCDTISETQTGEPERELEEEADKERESGESSSESESESSDYEVEEEKSNAGDFNMGELDGAESIIAEDMEWSDEKMRKRKLDSEIKETGEQEKLNKIETHENTKDHQQVDIESFKDNKKLKPSPRVTIEETVTKMRNMGERFEEKKQDTEIDENSVKCSIRETSEASEQINGELPEENCNDELSCTGGNHQEISKQQNTPGKDENPNGTTNAKPRRKKIKQEVNWKEATMKQENRRKNEKMKEPRNKDGGKSK